MAKDFDIAILLFDGITPLDAIGPFDVLGKVPGAHVKCVRCCKHMLPPAGGVARACVCVGCPRPRHPATTLPPLLTR